VNSSISGLWIEILLVDGSPGDVRLIEEPLKDSGAQNRLHAVRDGKDAIAFLCKKGGVSRSPACRSYSCGMLSRGRHG